MDAPRGRRRCRDVSGAVVGGLELFFYRYGRAIGRHPWRFVGACAALAAVAALGVLRLRQEKHPLRLWIPPSSDFARDTEWLMTQFREGYRVQAVLATADDVLQPRVLRQLADIHQAIVAISADGAVWESVCFRIPVISMNLRRKREAGGEGGEDDGGGGGGGEGGGGGGGGGGEGDLEPDGLGLGLGLGASVGDLEGDINLADDGWPDFDPSVVLPIGMYCHIVDSLETGCLASSVLELWKYNATQVAGLTKAQILAALNTTIGPVLGHPTDFRRLLGAVRRDARGHVVSAGAVLSLYMLRVNFSAVNMDESGNEAGTADWATGAVLAWEKSFLEVMQRAAADVQGMKVYYEAGRSYGDISAAAMFQDMDKLAVGIVLMFVYVQVILSNFNMVEFRFLLANVGLVCVGLAFVVAVGLCSLMGISYGPVHTALPFLLLGIGVDDMFVIMACWRNLTPAERQLRLAERMGRTLQHAGPSITITSLTDVVAFLVGASTILPSLQSFCLYAAMGVLITYIFQATLFVAFFVLDERRVQKARNGLLFCVRHRDYKPNACSQVNYSKKIFHKVYANGILTLPGQILVILITIGFTAISIKGNFELKQKFDPIWFLSEKTHLYQFIKERSYYYPDMGQDAGVYFGSLNYSAELPKIRNLIAEFKNQTDILKDVEDWYGGFEVYVNKNFNIRLPEENLTKADFHYLLSRYLFSPSGASFQKNFRFNGTLKCGEPAPPITVSSFDFKFKLFHGPEESLPAMNRVKHLVKKANFTTGDRFATVWGKIFANWVTDEVIDTELYRNLILACVCVMICTVVLIVNLVTCFFVFVCVMLTLVNVAGMMYFWGLTIDIVSCIGLELAAGLCVDYAAHIGHTFLTCSGTRRERALKTVVDIGPAILSGGVATLLALAVLANSESYIFVSFFKIFLLVVLFGLFHGVVFLPVVLSFIGPAPYQSSCNLDVQLQANKLYDLCDQIKDGKEKTPSFEEPS